MNETIIADTWLYSVLSSDAATAAIVGTRIYGDIADQDAAYPYIVYQMQSPGNDVSVIGMHRIFATPLYLVRVIEATNGYSDNAIVVANRIDALLHRASGAVSGGYNIATNRERPFRLTEIANGRQVRHLGGLYRLRIQSS